jgi:hypothetical protein
MIKKFYSTSFLFVLLLMILTSCVTANITSNKSPDFTQKVQKIFITGRSSEASKAYLQSVVRYTQTYLKAHKVETEFYYFDQLSLVSDSELNDRINQYNPDAVMVINETERRSRQGQFYQTINSGSTCDIKLFLIGKDNPVWRASLVADGNQGVEEASEQASKYLYDKLKTDGIIPF